MKKKKKTGKAPTYTAVLTSAAVLFAVILIIGTVIGGNNAASKDTDTDSKDLVNDSGTSADTDEKVTETESEALTDTETETETTSAPEIDPPPPQKTVPVGIYVETSRKKYESITEYVSKWPENDSDKLWRVDTWTYPGQKNLISDIEYFAVFASSEPEIKVTYWDETWVDEWDNNVEDKSSKIGFEFTVCLKNGETVTETVLGPADTFVLERYFELYLYDCVAHAHDSWYSHITEKTNYADTQNVMVKITLRDGCYDVEKILMTAFVYTPDEIDENGDYTGANKTTCEVKRG